MSLFPNSIEHLTPQLPVNPPRVRLNSSIDAAAAETARPVTLIGSRRDCDLFLRNSDVSKVHCAVINTGDEILAADLGTRGGTCVNGQRITVARLKDGDEIQIAGETVYVRIDGVQALSAPGGGAPRDAERNRMPALRITTPEGRHEISELPAVIGRRHTCQIVLDTPDVSLAHALLFAIRRQPVIFDLGSRSGTYLNTQRVMLSWLRPGDGVRIGGVDLTVDWDEPCMHAALAQRVGEHGFVVPSNLLAQAGFRAEAPFAPDSATPATADADLKRRRAELNAVETALAQRRAGLDAFEARLSAREAELQQREVALAEREAAVSARETAASDREAVKPTGGRPATEPKPGLAVRDDDEIVRELPAPLVMKALFPRIG